MVLLIIQQTGALILKEGLPFFEFLSVILFYRPQLEEWNARKGVCKYIVFHL